jgi:hypothetical protein
VYATNASALRCVTDITKGDELTMIRLGCIASVNRLTRMIAVIGLAALCLSPEPGWT